ncbi:helix-turn-helix transcriptional regulator [Mycolicibacterium moriokaense]|uniref:LuxR family transcriptional regulator n=1 Tax=Mycolicibacterium moriokaense TaxID=39691 RepID=A0AAD1HJ17_9MYCO|nr:isoniazid response ATPase/transcriptional regulator IniR [Mycolicibacterium moriokaense]MCV7042363.1 helix-turn-helix transcriptional regulator [Mycolicibacterium moriokaense]ORB23027.1 helix-turn-helix transcriptional regulator [Mycolicibacterium moriokaense]BBX05136.1 LuxR family transcriptional regulator [Mycolicibacterium moriokaense]
MPKPAPEHAAEIPPPARDAVAALTAAPGDPVKMLVSGGIGSGKSSVLAAVRAVLRTAGVPVLTRPPRSGDDPKAAVVIDDVHLLDDDELAQLVDLVSDPASTVVVATEPLAHRPALRALTTAIERENPVVSVGALSPADVTRICTETFDAPPTSEFVRALMTTTAGLPFLLQPAIAAASSREGEARAAEAAGFALMERLRRLEEPVLDTVLVMSLSPDLGPDDVAATLRIEARNAQTLVDSARASGLLEPSHSPTFLLSVHSSIAQIIGAARHHDIEIALLVSQIESSTLSADLALRLAEHGLRDDRLANALAELAAENQDRPARAARLYRAATDAGATKLNSRLADALALTGDCTAAGRIADDLLGSNDPAERAAAVRIAASIAAHDGSSAQAADLFRWLGPYPDAFVSAAGAVVSLAVGDLPTARAVLSVENAGPPTSTSRAARNLAEGLLLSLEVPYPAAVARLGQAIVADPQPTGVAPDTSAALVTLAALHGGDPVRARSVIGRAVRAAPHDDPESVAFVARRHRLLLGWVKMLDGQLPPATADVTAVAADGPLHRRDALWAAALQTAIARRSGDTGAVQKHWYTAMEVLAEYSMDLFSLLPLGELWVAAARMRQVDRLQHTLDEAFALLESLGKPLLWSVPLHWAGVHAGILANSPEAVAPHGQALTAAAGQSAFAKALAQAGRTWLRVLANHVDTDEVSAAARTLSQFGLTWDATRLASQAALQTPDGRVSGAMLQLARDLKQTSLVDAAPDVDASTAGDAPPGPTRPASTRLSDREREVAELLLLGMPYRDIGTQLFISAKTVEHHVARIRRRLGAESRSEMLSMLRAMLSPRN